MTVSTTYRIAVIPGDGIGKEVVPEGMRVLEAAASRFNFRFEWEDRKSTRLNSSHRT